MRATPEGTATWSMNTVPVNHSLGPGVVLMLFFVICIPSFYAASAAGSPARSSDHCLTGPRLELRHQPLRHRHRNVVPGSAPEQSPTQRVELQRPARRLVALHRRLE